MMMKWPYLTSVGVLTLVGVYAVWIIYSFEQEMARLRKTIEEHTATESSLEELLNAALEGELPSEEVRQRAWKVFLVNRGLSS